MTISEQIREVALYARDAWASMKAHQVDMCCEYRTPGAQSLAALDDTDIRTFMLLVAEALEA